MPIDEIFSFIKLIIDELKKKPTEEFTIQNILDIKKERNLDCFIKRGFPYLRENFDIVNILIKYFAFLS